MEAVHHIPSGMRAFVTRNNLAAQTSYRKPLYKILDSGQAQQLGNGNLMVVVSSGDWLLYRQLFNVLHATPALPL